MIRQSLSGLAKDHALFSSLEHGRTRNRTPFLLIALQAKWFNRLGHHGIIGWISEGFLAFKTEVSSHGEYARTDSSADSNPLAASDADDRRNERGQGKARALAGTQVEEKAVGPSGKAYDSGG